MNQDHNDGAAASQDLSTSPLRCFAPSREAGIPNVEEISALVVDCGYKLHVEAGPGLLESVYEVVLARMLEEQGLAVRRQVPVPIQIMGLKFDEGFRADLLVEDRFLIELKSVERLLPVHSKQVLTYLRLLTLPLGLLINYGAPTFREGVHRIANHHQDLMSSRLRVNQTDA
jgi:GxxExxY protein